MFVALLTLLAGLWNLAGPGMWWDEGWTLSVARSWVERGLYGRLQLGQPAPPGLEAAISVTAPVALGMRLFGVGLWQGRLAGVLFLAAALALLFELARRLYNRRVAWAALFVLLLTPMHPQLHPLLNGRQVLAETPMLMELLLGYLALLAALRGRRAWILAASLCWGLALATKLQAQPFWLASLALPLLAALLRRRWADAALIAVGLAGALLAARGVDWLRGALLAGHTLPLVPISGLYEVMAFVLTSFNRAVALRMTLLLALPTLFGLIYAALGVRAIGSSAAEPGGEAWPRDLLRLALLGMAGSWLAWYTLLSVGVPRYLYPATFFGSVFVAALLHDITGGFDARVALAQAAGVLRGRFSRRGMSTWLALLALPLMVMITLFTLNRYYLNNTDQSAQQAAAWLNIATPPAARIETYESELHFLLDRPYHFPPDQLHVELNRRSLLHQDVAIDYDALAADPDYLVVGQFARENRLYQPAIERGDFRAVQTFGEYVIYQRVR